MFVCPSVCLHRYLQKHMTGLHQFLCMWQWLVLLLRHCDTLYRPTSGLVNYVVVFVHNGPLAHGWRTARVCKLGVTQRRGFQTAACGDWWEGALATAPSRAAGAVPVGGTSKCMDSWLAIVRRLRRTAKNVRSVEKLGGDGKRVMNAIVWSCNKMYTVF